jgi:hypothetical protein
MRFLLLFLLLGPGAFSQSALPSIADKTKDMQVKGGFIPLYADTISGKLYMEISKWEEPILYHMSLAQGLGSNDIGLDRGLQAGGRIVVFKKSGRKVLLVEPNQNFRAVTNDLAEKKAVEQSFASSTLWGFSAEAETNGKFLIDATDFLLRDAMQVSSRMRVLQQGSFSLEKSRSTLNWPRIKNFPLNTVVETSLTFVNSDGITGKFVNAVTPSSEAFTLSFFHGFVQLPDDGYVTRKFDPRSSFNAISYFDYSTPVSTPIEQKIIIRHRLQKKNPDAEKSEPVKPIIYYLDNGTPEPIRSALLEGGRWWNQAFEEAGFINAFRMELLPDSADPMDIRYNMVNWVHRSTRGWSYGASVIDPRTGEIMKGNVTLGSLRVRQDYLIAQGLLSPFETGEPLDPDKDPMLKMALNRLKQLSAHEIGHTLGLMHNYAASVSNRASVMDYPHPKIMLDKNGNIDLSDAYDLKIGVWDKVSINWGYRQFSPNTNEKAALHEILTKASGEGLQFISDRDARDPAGMHPYAHLWDNGNNATEELEHIMTVRQKALQQFGRKAIQNNLPLAMLEDALVPVYFLHRYQVEAAVKLIGGLNYTYALRGDGQVPVAAIEKTVQIHALKSILHTIEPAQLKLPDTLLYLIPPRPAGYAMTSELFSKRTGLSFDALSPAEAAADFVFSLLLHPERLNRITQQQFTMQGLTLEDMLQQIRKATYEQPRLTGMQGLIQQQNEQLLLTYFMSLSIDKKTNYPVKAIIQNQLKELKKILKTKEKDASNPFWQGHYELALERMDKPELADIKQYPEPPPGAPIGCGDLF